MDFRDKKWQLMIRDPLCLKFDKVLHDHLLDPNNDRLFDLRMELTQKIKEKWNAGIYVPEAFTAFGRTFEEDPDHPSLKGLKKKDFVGPFKWWSITGDPYPIVENVKNQATMLYDKNGKLDLYCVKNKDCIYCPPHKIPILIDPTGLTILDAKKVKDAVWKIVEQYLEKNTQRDETSEKEEKEKREKLFREMWIAVSNRVNKIDEESSYANPDTTKKNQKWNPTLPPGESKELAKIFHLKEQTFYKYLSRYDLKKEEGLTFRLIAIIEQAITPEKQRETINHIIKAEKQPKIGHSVRGESGVRRGFNIIFRAIYRTEPPSREQDIETQKKYNCPEHGQKCPSDCKNIEKWMATFSRTYREKPLMGQHTDPIALDKLAPYSSGKRKQPPKKDY